MGLIGVSIKGYPIFAIPKKNKIKFALAKIQASPLAKIEYDRIRWEGIGGKRSKKNHSRKILFFNTQFNDKDKKRKQLKENQINGKRFEQKDFKIFKKECPNAQSQVTLRVYDKNKPIVTTRVDAIAHCKGKIIIREAKSSKDASLTSNKSI